MSALRTAVTRPLHSFSAALRFLTVFPGVLPARDDQRYFGGASYYFTIVGIVTGCLIGGGAIFLSKIAPPVITGVAVAICMSLISGFLHLDGLADTADGFLSCRDRGRSLEIMKDSRIGVMGTVSVISLLLLKTAALLSLPVNELISIVIISSAAGRTAAILMMSFLPYARVEGGLGNLFFDDGSTPSVSVVSVAFLLVAMVLLAPGKLLVLSVMFIITMVLFCTWCMRKIGGYTGDTLGAVCELMEMAMLTGAVLIF